MTTILIIIGTLAAIELIAAAVVSYAFWTAENDPEEME